MSYDLVNRVQLTLPLFGGKGRTPSDFLVLRAIALHQNGKIRDRIEAGEIADGSPEAQEEWAWTSVSRLAYECGVSESSVSRALRSLRMEGMIDVIHEQDPPPDRSPRCYKRVNRRKLEEMVDSLPAFRSAWEKQRGQQRKKEKARSRTAQTEVALAETQAIAVERVEAVIPEPGAESAEGMIIQQIKGYAANGVPPEPDPETHESLQLAVLLFNLVGHPTRLAGIQALTDSVSVLNKLCDRVGSQRVRNVMTWVFAARPWEWAERITGSKNPADYFAEKYSTQLERQYLAALATAAHPHPETHQPTATPEEREAKDDAFLADLDAQFAAPSASLY